MKMTNHRRDGEVLFNHLIGEFSDSLFGVAIDDTLLDLCTIVRI